MEPVPEDWTRGIVVVAHPDDIEYGAAAAVARWTRQGKDLRYVLATSGEAGIAGLPPAECGPLREEEERASAAIVGVESVEFLGHPDGRLVAGPDLRRDVAGAIRRHRPEMVVTANFGLTWFPGMLNSADHRALGLCVLDAVSDAANEWIFPELSVEQGLAPWPGVRWVAVNTPAASHAVDVTGTVDVAVESLAAHRRYLEALSDIDVVEQARAQVDMATGPLAGFPATRAVGFDLYTFAG
ncbi:PIG-L family deacetylase [Rhodococcus sp. HNM0563]|uniref:PIG-L deacetylase family protein n=1 Tax=unclassified Rhodococcus (in: high G+C Gram-positive bacteria) TaxID=192944 RepID=UPI00146A6108|nr:MULTISPECIES: PIG-L deacetylase family protein [unclassified Rhodococcus (in: high G+C Gram-positive bacteria)]MCK0092154.1 PIG-L family deacetylase [Rhodococcus sp. F64268]NLU63370.1 PIG-L family deacetylase [Rhodococcus sp. HNM0563]